MATNNTLIALGAAGVIGAGIYLLTRPAGAEEPPTNGGVSPSLLQSSISITTGTAGQIYQLTVNALDVAMNNAGVANVQIFVTIEDALTGDPIKAREPVGSTASNGQLVTSLTVPDVIGVTIKLVIDTDLTTAETTEVIVVPDDGGGGGGEVASLSLTVDPSTVFIGDDIMLTGIAFASDNAMLSGVPLFFRLIPPGQLPQSPVTATTTGNGSVTVSITVQGPPGNWIAEASNRSDFT